jgi:hypothetical protein
MIWLLPLGNCSSCGIGGSALSDDEVVADTGPKRLARRRQVSGRNTGWYIPFWRKPKRALQDSGQSEKGERRRRVRSRSEHELDKVREDWIFRYNAQLRALRALGLGVGAPNEEIRERYECLRAELLGRPEESELLRELQSAYELLHPDS